MKITLLLPAKDEAAGIAQTIDALPVETLKAEGHTVDVVVLDGHSSDGTAEIARAHGARIITDPGEGKGKALRIARTVVHGDIMVMLDADGSYAPDAIPALIDPLLRGEADVVMGDRIPLSGSMSGLHKFGNAVLSAEASILYGRRCQDVCTGLWAFNMEAFQGLPLRSKGFELEAEMFALSNRLHLRVMHAPVDYLPRAGETKLSAARDGWRICWCLLRTRFERLAPVPRMLASVSTEITA